MKDDPLYQLFAAGTLASFKGGEIIARSDESNDTTYMIKSGYVKVYSLNSHGEEYLHIIYRAGEIFPIIWMAGKLQQGVFYAAIDNVSVYSLPGNFLLEKVRNDARLSMAMTMQVIRQFNIYVDRVDNLEYKFGRERLAYRLLFLASRFGRNTARGLTIDVPLTQKSLGTSINLSRETVARELHRLETRGLVVYEDRRIIILNVDHLCNELKDVINSDFWGLKTSNK